MGVATSTKDFEPGGPPENPSLSVPSRVGKERRSAGPSVSHPLPRSTMCVAVAHWVSETSIRELNHVCSCFLRSTLLAAFKFLEE